MLRSEPIVMSIKHELKVGFHKNDLLVDHKYFKG